MFKQNIEKVLRLLSIFPPLLVILLSIITTTYIYVENQKKFEYESLKLKKEFLNRNRLEIYNEVNNIYEYINNEYADTELKLKKDLKDRVTDAYSIVMGIIKNNKNLNKEQLVKLVKDALREIRFNDGRGYYYIYSMEGECILLPIQSKLEGSSFLDIKDKKGKYITRSIIKSLENGKEEFMHWWWYKPGDVSKQYKKISFNKYIEELDMYVGTGDYINDFESVFKKNVLNYISKVKYNFNDYIFVLDFDGNVLSHSNNTIVNKNIKDLDSIDYINLKEIINIAKLGEGFISYESDFFGKYDKRIIKTSFIKGLNKWDWAIGTGFYKHALDNEINEKQIKLHKDNREFVLKMITFSIFITLILILINFYNVRFLKNRFKIIQRKIKKEIELNNEKDKILFQQSKMASLGEMLQNIAHQWRQPLSIISTAASGMKLKKDYNILDDKYIDDTVSTIMKSTIYLSKTIDDFRDFFKIDKKEEFFVFTNIISDTLDILNLKINKQNISVILDIDDGEYHGLKNELIQVLMNIINNAIDAFTNQSKKYIFINIKIGTYINIEIIDNAGGIENNIIDRVFEPYFTTKHQSQGTGIGLYMSEQIILKHLFGELSVENIEYIHEGLSFKGASFSIKLPIKKGQL